MCLTVPDFTLILGQDKWLCLGFLGMSMAIIHNPQSSAACPANVCLTRSGLHLYWTTCFTFLFLGFDTECHLCLETCLLLLRSEPSFGSLHLSFRSPVSYCSINKSRPLIPVSVWDIPQYLLAPSPGAFSGLYDSSQAYLINLSFIGGPGEMAQ